MRPFKRERGRARGNSIKNVGVKYGRGRGIQRDRSGRKEVFDNKRERFDQNDHRYTKFRSSEHTKRNYEADDSYNETWHNESYWDEGKEVRGDYNREEIDYSNSKRHASDIFENSEMGQYHNDDIAFNEYGRDYEKESRQYEKSDYEVQNYREEKDVKRGEYYEHEIETVDERYKRRGDSFNISRRQNYQHRDRHENQNRHKSRERHPYTEKRDDGFKNNWKEEREGVGIGFRDKKFGSSNTIRGRIEQKNWTSRTNFDSSERSVKSVLNEEKLAFHSSSKSTTSSCDWATNESGIKMAIEYLKNKPLADGALKKDDAEEDLQLDEEEKQLPIINPESLKEEAVEDLISDLLNLILRKGGEVAISVLEKDFINSVKVRFKDESALMAFLKNYPQVFEFDTERSVIEEPDIVEIVRAKTEVKLCPSHSTHPKSCKGECNSLHICKFYVLSSCEISRCKFGHNLSDDHNITVQQKFYLHRVELPNLCLLLQHDANRCSVTVPVVCRFYNSMKGCRSEENSMNQQQQQKCPFLHICQNFVEDRCQVWSSCRRNHKLDKGNVYEILCKYGLDPKVLLDGKNRVLSLLRASINEFKEKDGELKNRYRPIQLKNEEKARHGLKRKVQVGGDDDITVKIKKVMETSLSQIACESNAQEQNAEDEKGTSIETDTYLETHNEVVKLVTKDTMLESDSALDKNMNVSESSKNSQTSMEQKSEERISPSWSISENNKWKEISPATLKDLEEKYQRYLIAKTATVLMDGKYFKIDFSKLEGNYAGSSNIIKVKRDEVWKRISPNASKDSEKIREIPDSFVTEEQMSEKIQTEDQDSLFENVKDIDFIKF